MIRIGLLLASLCILTIARPNQDEKLRIKVINLYSSEELYKDESDDMKFNCGYSVRKIKIEILFKFLKKRSFNFYFFFYYLIRIVMSKANEK